MKARDPWRVVIVGKSGSGKTHAARVVIRAILDARKAAGLPSRLLIFDPKREWHPRGATFVYSRTQLVDAMIADLFPIVVRAVFSDWPPLQYVNLVVVFDEAHRIARPRELPRTIATFVREGRAPQTAEWIAISQRPADLAPDFWANPTHALVFPLCSRADRDAVQRGLAIFLPASWPQIETPGGTRYAPLIWPQETDADSEDVQAAEVGPETKGKRRRS